MGGSRWCTLAGTVTTVVYTSRYSNRGVDYSGYSGAVVFDYSGYSGAVLLLQDPDTVHEDPPWYAPWCALPITRVPVHHATTTSTRVAPLTRATKTLQPGLEYQKMDKTVTNGCLKTSVSVYKRIQHTCQTGLSDTTVGSTPLSDTTVGTTPCQTPHPGLVKTRNIRVW